ncbi:MAG: glutamine--fructose-6-phosphate transaminase (isomerizing) [Thermaerobacterales bacterium]
MCGIVGYIGPRAASPILIEGLKRLEYRGYDSAGLAIPVNGAVAVWKSAGRIACLEALLQEQPPNTVGIGIGHTRWATHGRPTDSNAHPHTDQHDHVAVVHNGIIENHGELRQRLVDQGCVMKSETDTEVIPHLIARYYDGDLLAAVRRAVADLEGAFALAVVSSREPERMIAVRQFSPLVLGFGDDENFVASDLPAILPYTRRVYILQDGEMADISSAGIRIFDGSERLVQREPFTVDWDPGQAEKDGYEHFMLKEIHEQPRAVADTLAGRVFDADARLDDIELAPADVDRLDQVYLLACGTAYHAGLVGAALIEELAGIPARAELASEFRYRRPLVNDRSLAIVISQSGETADTLAALHEARQRGARILAVSNVVGSSVAREADDVLYTRAGPEIAVASTKAYMTQLVAMVLIAVRLGRANGRLSAERAGDLLSGLQSVPRLLEEVLTTEDDVAAVARELAPAEHAFYLGRGLDWTAAMEGQLKLKEISYIHAEAYAAGELKHGTLALITEGTPVIALMTQPHLLEKMLSNIEEVRARGGRIVAVAPAGQKGLDREIHQLITVPRVNPLLTPLVCAVPLQLLAYYAAVERGCDVDKPRNLAKSVTVE